MRKITSVNRSVFGFVCLVLIGLSSCKTSRLVTSTAPRPISANKLIRNIQTNAFDYNQLSIKRINCQFDNGKTRTSFRASIFAEKDKQITVMLSKLNFPVARIWLSPDSVKFINYFESTYFQGDYSYLSAMLGMDLDFEMVHNMITNTFFSDRGDKHEYVSRIDSGFYILESVNQLKTKKNDERKSIRKVPLIQSDAPVYQAVFIDPETFKIRKIQLEDTGNSRMLQIGFSDFLSVNKQLYPGEISLNLNAPESVIQLKIKLGGFSMEQEKEIRFRVPEKYTRIN